jgi:hypothetical protein
MRFEHPASFSPQQFSPGTDIRTEPLHPEFHSEYPVRSAGHAHSQTGSSAMLWTNATNGKTRIADISVIETAAIQLGGNDPKEKYGELVPELVYVNTRDFRMPV